jgi:hypothetical protein
MTDSDRTTHPTDEFTEEGDCKDSVACITQPLEPNDFVLLKLTTMKRVKYFFGLIQELEPNFCNISYLNKRPKFWIFCLPKMKTLQ